MIFSAHRIRLAIVSLIGFLLISSCLYAGAKIWQQRNLSESVDRVSMASNRERDFRNEAIESTTLPAGRGTNSANEAERNSLIQRLREKRAKLAEGRYDKPNEAMEFFRLKRLAEGQTEIPVEKYQEAYRQMELMPQHTFGNDSLLPSRKQTSKNAVLPAWTSLGPGNIGGRTRAIIIHPTTPATIYAAGGAGGVWKTTNGGGTWLPISDLISNLAINALAMDPTNPNTLYAGTGEGFFNGDAQRGAGIFKTTDGGANWMQLANTTSTDFYYVNDIVVSPTNANRVYAATRSGIWRSTDGGTNWTKVQNVTEVGSTTTAIFGGCLDLAIRTDKATDYIFASCGNQTQARIFRNTDAGGSGTWTQVHTEASAGRTSLAIAPSNQDIIYALSAELDGTFDDALHAVFRSTASGDAGTWEARVRNSDPNKLNASILSFAIGAFATNCSLDTTNLFGAQAWYDNVIAVDPTDPNRVWVGGVDVFRSDDGGANWGMAAHAYQARSNPQYVHADQHVIIFHPQYNGTSNQTVFIGNDGGIFRSDNARAVVATGNNAPCNAAATAVNWISLNNGYGVTQFYHGSVYPNGTTYFGGTQDNGTIRGSDSAGANAWNEIWPGDGGHTAVDPTNTNILFAANTGISVQKSTNGGTSFNLAINGIADSGLFITPYVMDPSEPQRLFLGGNLYIWRTKNGAARWQQASAITPGTGSVSAITVSPTNANFALAGMSDGFLIRTDQALTSTSTTTWPSVQPRGGYVSSVAFDPTNKDIAYATYSTFGGVHVWKTINAGVTWTGLNGTGAGILPDVPVHSIVVDPTNTMRLYIGTDVGVFASTDGGTTWAVENTGFANVITEWLTINATSNTTQLFAFTHGRGAWRVTANPTGCNFALAPYSQTFDAAGGNGTIAVTAQPNGCNWTAVSNAAWITINSGASGMTNGTTAFSVAAYTGTNPRTGTITAAGKTFTVTQNGCATISPGFQYFEAAGGAGSITVTASGGCTWTTTGNPSWVMINSGSAGTGNGSVAFTVAANTSISSRQAVLTVAGQSFTINQGGMNGSCVITPIAAGQAINGALAANDCYSLQRGQFFPADRYSFTGTAGQRVAIRADSSTVDTFLYLIDPTGSVVAANDDSDFRTSARIPAGTSFFMLPAAGTYQIEVTSFSTAAATGAYTVSLSNGSTDCSYSAAPSEQSFAAVGGNGSVNVTVTGNGCDWTAVSNAPWLTITSGATGSGNGTVNFNVAANTGFSRTAYLIVAGQLVAITQSGTGTMAIGRWATQASGTTNHLNHVFFLDDNQGWTVGASSTSRSTSNGGTAWNGFTVSAPLQNFNSVRFFDTTNGWVGGEKTTAITSNGGSSWPRLDFTTGTRNRLFPVNTTSAFGIGERAGGGFHASTFIFLIFGIGQETPSLTTLNTLRDIYFANSENGWSVGDKGQIFRLSKSGNAFDEQTGATTQNLNGIFALDLCTAWAVGDGGMILKTINAGQTWTPQTSGVMTALRDIHFINADRGWAVGDSGVILVTWDGGANWTPETSGVTADLRSVHTNSINAVYAVGTNGTIVKRSLCTYTLSATMASFNTAGGSGSVNVTSVAGCPWTATSNDSWITINSGSPGSGNGTLNFSVATNTGLARIGTITVAGQTFTVNQSVACLTVTGIMPPRGGVGSSVTITGTNLSEVTSVKFASNVTAQFTVNSATQITATIPAGAVTGPITISKTGCTDVQTASFIVCNPITINPATLSAGAVGLAYNQTLTASGGTAAYSFAVTTGILPSGLTLSTGGTISGSPIVTGTFNISITATDSNGCTGTRAYSLVVACPTITLSPTTLPNGLAGSAYNQSVTASPVLTIGSYSYAVTSGALPTGLSLNATTGAITGTPTTAGTSNFTVTASSLGCNGSQSYSIFIQPICPTVSSINPPSGVIGANLTITGANFTGVNSVKFANNVPATFTVVSNTQITVTVPAGAVTGAITIGKEFCTDVTTAAYTVLPTPVITLSPSSALIGVGQSVSFTATINPALQAAINLTLTSSNPAVATVPLAPSIPAGQTSAQFIVPGVSAGIAMITAAVPALYGGASANSNLTVAAGFEADVSPRPNGEVNGQITIADWAQVGRFIAGLDAASAGSEFQRADCAPLGTLGDGLLTARDWVQAGRYAAGLDPIVAMGGPTAPTLFANVDKSSAFAAVAPSLVRAEMVQNKSVAAVGKDQQVIKLMAQGGENAVSFSLMFQPSQWQFLIAELTDETDGATLIVNREQAAEGRLGFMFAYPAGKTLPAGEIRLFTVTFDPVENITDPLFVAFGDRPAVREVSDANANRLPSSFVADYSFAGVGPSANVSAASFTADRFASDQIVAVFGSDLATTIVTAATLPLPTSLGGTTVTITDSKGDERLAGLFFVSPGQINYLLPADLAEGIARVTITADGKTSVGLIDVATIAPGLFTANSDGQGLAAAVLLRVRSDGSQNYEAITRFDSASNRNVAVPIEFGEAGEQLFLLLYGTGLRHNEGRAIKATVGEAEVPVQFAGAAEGFAGLDQINLGLPRSLAGRGEVEIRLAIDDRTANVVKIVVR